MTVTVMDTDGEIGDVDNESSWPIPIIMKPRFSQLKVILASRIDRITGDQTKCNRTFISSGKFQQEGSFQMKTCTARQ